MNKGIYLFIFVLSAGVGRTGTLIALWNIIELLDADNQLIKDVQSEVLRIREYRSHLVQTKVNIYLIDNSYILLNILLRKNNYFYWLIFLELLPIIYE